jgi:hypothetical protein
MELAGLEPAASWVRCRELTSAKLTSRDQIRMPCGTAKERRYIRL